LKQFLIILGMFGSVEGMGTTSIITTIRIRTAITRRIHNSIMYSIFHHHHSIT
jgi:hypothetical protein